MAETIRTGAGASGASTGVTTPLTRVLLACGLVGGPLFLVVVLAQALTREGFDLTRHPLSLLSLGPGGWIQIANFLVTGVLFVAFAAGIRRSLRGTRGGTWGALLVGACGVGLLGGGVFSADPALGFPPGTPSAASASISWHALLHLVAFIVGVPSLGAACVVFARRFAGLGEPGWVAFSLAVAVCIAVSIVVTLAGASFGVMAEYVALLLGWTWVPALAGRLLARDI
ncbi:MAG TPA: DUF998 domain-containing protein [Candidatus Binatia bacterium]|jgi:hypothetical membrane protein|nr:DUF998 domain-containing protein [Candidatus Binatia bacterium]